MLKGQDEHAFYLKELMRLQPIAYEEARKIFASECDLREDGLEEKADLFREVKCELYLFTFDCRIRNGDLIEGTALNRKERRFLRLRYVRAWSWRQLFEKMGYSADHCKRIHRDAIAKVARHYPDADFETMYKMERARLSELLTRVGEKLR